MKTRTEKILVLLFINLVSIALAVFLGERAYHQWQERDFQLKVHRALIAGDQLPLAQSSRHHSGWIGDKYVTAYYRTEDGEDIPVVKERIDAETQALQQAQPQLADEMKELIFYGSQERESDLAGLKQLSIQKVVQRVDKHEIGPAEESQVSSLYTDADGQEVTLSHLFVNPELARSNLLAFVQQQLTFRGLSEEQVVQILTDLENLDLTQWQFSYGNAAFTIKLPHRVGEVVSIDVPVSELYNTIDATYLQGQDLDKYNAYQEQRHKKVVALTFDDGPNPTTTPQALDILKKYKAKATFFMVGKAVAGNEAIIQRVLNEGHAIGNHSWDHPVLTNLTVEQAQAEINSTTEALQKAGVKKVHLMRPPYGAISQTIQNAVDQSFILWDIDSLDWKNRNTASIMSEVKKTQPGSIILMHDIHQTTIDALPTVIEYLQSQGYELVTVDELMGDQLELHKAYYSRN